MGDSRNKETKNEQTAKEAVAAPLQIPGPGEKEREQKDSW
jgi:hypothetical protein